MMRTFILQKISFFALCLAALPSFAALDVDCEFSNKRSYQQANYEITVGSEGGSSTSFKGTIVVFLTEESGNVTIEKRYDRYGYVNSGSEMTVVEDAVPFRLQSCSAVFIGTQVDN